MADTNGLPDLLERTREERGDDIFYRFSNGLEIKTEIFHKSDARRILPLGTPQCSLMNHMLGFPETALGKRVFEPFAGSGALGFMALKAGAKSVDFLDVNPRAAEFHRANAALNQFPSEAFSSITEDIFAFEPQGKYDLLLANPPFVPTPDEIEGTLTSNGGPEGNRFVDVVLERIEDFLTPDGRALICVFQLLRDGEPLVLERLGPVAATRPVEITPAQVRATGFDSFCEAYRKLFPQALAAVDRWQSALREKHGARLTLCHYVVDVGSHSDFPAACMIRDDFAEKFGDSFLVPSDNDAELAFGRALENFVPPDDPS